ncbi:hypothetical protein [Nocardia vinacea]|uniref:hypothetical protein n=1 Tax=Nocardia vinacea TaxID=96468 RepID=UPI0002E6A257|nr:hypothetical protein [Nocardia vinacea]
MITNTTRVGPFDTLDAQLLILDPDVESLFAEVEQILCEALARMPAAPRPLVPVPGLRAPARPLLSEYFQRLRGRRPRTGRATQRGPPPRRGTSRNRTAQPEESEVMPVTDSGNDRRGGDEVPTPTRRIRER